MAALLKPWWMGHKESYVPSEFSSLNSFHFQLAQIARAPLRRQAVQLLRRLQLRLHHPG